MNREYWYAVAWFAAAITWTVLGVRAGNPLYGLLVALYLFLALAWYAQGRVS